MTMSGNNHIDPLAFLGTGSGMAALIKSFDWSRTPLGAIGKWPAHLTSITSFMLRSNVPMTLLWGTEGIMLYNDAYQEFAGQRHPALLGSPVLEGWAEVADFNASVMHTCLAGGTLSYRDQHLVLSRQGRPADAWLTLDYSPVIDQEGLPSGVMAIVRETTDRVLAERKLNFAQEVGGIGTFEWFPDTGRLDVSDQYRQIWRIAPDTEVTETLLVSLIHPDDRHLMGPNRYGSPNPISYAEFRRVDAETGGVRWIARRGEAVTFAALDRRRYIGIAMDITERKDAEEAVARSEYRWRELFERMQEGFFVGDAIRDDRGEMVDFLLLEINPAFGTQTGLDASAAVGRSIRELIPSLDNSVIETYAEVVKTGKPIQFEIHVPALNDRWFEARARRLDANRFAVLFVDISSRKVAEEVLRESEGRFRLLAQSMPNQVWTGDSAGQLDWFNDRVYDYFKAAQGTLDGGQWTAKVHPDDLGGALATWNESLSLGTPYQTEFRLRRHDGQYRWYIARALPVRDKAGNVERWIGNNADIDDQKAAEAAIASLALTLEQRVEQRTADLTRTQHALRQSQKMEAIGNLTGGIAHDFNNLLQVISGNLQLLASDIKDSPRAQRRLDNAMTGVARGAKLASQLLSFGRRQPLAPRVVNPARLVRSMDEMLRRTLGEEIELETVISGGLWNALTDPSNLENALLNLAINARDAMNGQGHLTIETGNALLDDDYARAHADVKPGRYVLIAVTDTGCGMSADLIDKVFEPFFTTKPEGHGTGLGLSMVHGFVKQSGGHIKIYSEAGHGTSFKLYLPRTTQAEAVATDEDRGPIQGGSETILVAEDDESVRDIVVSLLTALGYQVLQARDAQGALCIIESGVHIDLLFTDVVMPGPVRSPELAKRARAHLPHLAVLFTSGYTENAIVHGGRLDEGVDLLSKPYTNDALARKIRLVLAARPVAATMATQVDRHRPQIAVTVESTSQSDLLKSKSLRILLCEDDELIRTAVAEMLQNKGHVVEETSTARQALEIYDESLFDLLVTDVGLPDSSGVDLAKALRARSPELPVVFATGRFDDDIVPSEKRTRTILKPYGSEDLLVAITTLTQ
jgi:PAS domain S-box-containing protein